MSHPAPDFTAPTLLPNGASWTATCESLDARNDCAYYFVTVTRDSAVVELWAQVELLSPQPIRAQVGSVAAAGASNTDYTGSVMWELKRKALANRP